MPDTDDRLQSFAQGTARDLRTLQVKLTHVGVQSKSVPSVAFTSFHHLLRLDWFTPHHANDDTTLWNFTVTPEENERIVKALHAQGFGRTKPASQPDLSLTLVLKESRLGDLQHEAILARDQTATVIATIRDALDPTNGIGRTVLQLREALLT